jgi:hypothetical protein
MLVRNEVLVLPMLVLVVAVVRRMRAHDEWIAITRKGTAVTIDYARHLMNKQTNERDMAKDTHGNQDGMRWQQGRAGQVRGGR